MQHVALLFHAQYEVNPREGGYLVSLELCVTPHYNDKGSRVFACETVNGLSTLVVSHIGDGASIDNADVGLLALLYRLYALAFELVA